MGLLHRTVIAASAVSIGTPAVPKEGKGGYALGQGNGTLTLRLLHLVHPSLDFWFASEVSGQRAPLWPRLSSPQKSPGSYGHVKETYPMWPLLPSLMWPD